MVNKWLTNSKRVNKPNIISKSLPNQITKLLNYVIKLVNLILTLDGVNRLHFLQAFLPLYGLFFFFNNSQLD